MTPDQITETFDEISTQLFKLGERIEELRRDVNHLSNVVDRLSWHERTEASLGRALTAAERKIIRQGGFK